jgi:proteic killer suppression protein
MLSMIKSFRCRRTNQVQERNFVKGSSPEIQKIGQRKLEILAAAISIEDLGRVPGNNLEELAGDRKGQHSIRINDQWRICFVFRSGDAYNVEIVDYH